MHHGPEADLPTVLALLSMLLEVLHESGISCFRAVPFAIFSCPQDAACGSVCAGPFKEAIFLTREFENLRVPVVFL